MTLEEALKIAEQSENSVLPRGQALQVLAAAFKGRNTVDYAAWRLTFQSSEAAAQSAFDQVTELFNKCFALSGMLEVRELEIEELKAQLEKFKSPRDSDKP